MWGFYNSRERNLSSNLFEILINRNVSIDFNWNKKNEKGNDQLFLARYVFQAIKRVSVVHDSYSCGIFGGKGFPTQRVGNCYVGGVEKCSRVAKFYECTPECRPGENRNWIYF